MVALEEKSGRASGRCMKVQNLNIICYFNVSALQ